MIVMIISDSPEAERKRIVLCAESQAAYHSDEHWRFVESDSVDDLKCFLEENSKVDMVCLDITMDGSIEMAERVRSDFSSSYITLIADTNISPIKYIRPSIRAESLMVKPLSDAQIETVLEEAVISYMKRLELPDDRRVFVTENKGSKNLISYDRILFFESREKKVFLSTEKEEYGFYDTLDELEIKLDDIFIRCHRSYIVNRERISRVELSAGRIILDDGTEIPMSRSYKKAVKDYLFNGK